MPDVRTEMLRLAAWRAGRSGLAGDLVHPVTGTPGARPRTCSTPCSSTCDPRCADAGDEDRVEDGVAALAPARDRRRPAARVHRETGDLAAVVRAAVAVTGGRDADDTAGTSGGPTG